MSEVILSDYFYGDESEQFIYFRIPRLLITSPRFKHLSTDAKLLYGMLLDRMSLSAKNNWYDEDGRVYIYYTVEEICGDMNCGRDKAMKLLAELDTGKGVGLIERIKQGQGKPTKIYVKRFTTPAVPGKKADEPAPKAEQPAPKESKPPEAEKKPEQATPATPGKKADEPAHKVEQAIPQEGKALEEKKPEQAVPPAAPGKKADEPAHKAEQTAPKEGKSPEAEKKPEQTIPAAPSKKADEPAPKAEQPAPKEGKTPGAEKKPETVVKAVGMAAKGPAGTQITQVFEDRLSPPDDKELKNLPTPKDGESYFIVLHPGYLEKSKFNTVSVDQNSEDYRELKKSIELNGVKDPVLTRINPDGGLEILSGQRRHMIARELNYPVPAIIQKIDDADAKILVSDGNLHRPKISTYDLSRTLRMKMEGMKQKAGRRKKGFTAEELNSDEKLAKEMGMSVSKLNRIIRLSEASKEVCNRVDDGTLPLSAASALSFLKPENQDVALHLTDLGYKLPTERIEYLKKVEKAGKLDEMTMRKVLDGENVLEPPKVLQGSRRPCLSVVYAVGQL